MYYVFFVIRIFVYLIQWFFPLYIFHLLNLVPFRSMVRGSSHPSVNILVLVHTWSMEWGRGCPLTSLEPRTSDQVLVLGEVFVDKLDQVLDLVEVFFSWTDSFLDLSRGFSRRAKTRTRTRLVVLSPRPTALTAAAFVLNIMWWKSPMAMASPTQNSVVWWAAENAGCTLQINEPHLQCSKHQCAKHQRVTHQPWVGEVQSTLALPKALQINGSIHQRKQPWEVVFTLSSIILNQPSLNITFQTRQ